MLRKINNFLGQGRGQQKRQGQGRPNKASRFAARPLGEMLEKRDLLAVTIDLPTAANTYTLTLTGDSSDNYIALYDFSNLNFPGFAGNEFLITDGGAMQPIQKCPTNGVG